MSQKIHLGIIGAVGRTGRQFIDAVAQADRAVLAGVADLERQACRRLAQQHRAKYYGSHARMLASDDIDGVIVCAPPRRRPKLADAAADAGKPVLVPLPIASSTAEADAMVRKVEETTLIAGAAAAHRFLPSSRLASEMLASGELGRIRTVVSIATAAAEGSWADRGGGILMGGTSQALDLLVWLLGIPKQVTAACWPAADSACVKQVASAVLDYGSGTHAIVHFRPPAWPGEDRLEVWAEAGRLVLGESLTVRKYDASSESSPRLGDAGPPDIGKGLAASVADFARAIRDADAPRVTLREAGRSLELGNAIVLAGERGGHVALPLDRRAHSTLLRKLRKAERGAKA